MHASGTWEIDLARRELRDGGTPIPIGGRAFDIMEALVLARGALVSKGELMAWAWPGLSVEENTLHVHIAAVRKALGEDRQMLKTASGRGYRLTGNWTVRDISRSPVAPPLDLPPAPPAGTNVPAAGTDMIGRDRELRHLKDLLSAYRVVTLAGPGGIGKTTLALQAARDLSPGFGGDVRLVELASVSSADLVASAVATAIGLKLGIGDIAPVTLATAVGESRLLLVIDNCEHVVVAAADTVEALVHRCPHVSVLATSREVLRVDGEYVYRVLPLDVPEHETEDRATILERSAVQLFIARTRALGLSLTLNEANLSVIAPICRHLDGIPLAIEFAAARVATLGLQEVAARLGSRFELLSGGRRTALRRHQTLRATLDWSYELLSEPERLLLRQLSIFPGGFTIDAAAAVVGAGSALGISDTLSNLVSKSLVSLDRSAPTDRWRLLETTRDYALEKLVGNGEADAAARRHAQFFSDFFPASAEGARPLVATGDLERFAREIDNVRAALDWCFSAKGDKAIGVVLTDKFVPVWTAESLWLECRERIERALDHLDARLGENEPVRLRLNTTLGLALVLTIGPVDRARAALGQALEIAESMADTDAVMRTLTTQFALHFNTGDIRAALLTASRHFEIATRVGDTAAVLMSQVFAGTANHHFGRQKEAQEILETLLQRFSDGASRAPFIGFTFDQRTMAGTVLVRALWLQGHLRRAYDLTQTLRQEAQASGNGLALWWALRFAICPLDFISGDLAAAERDVAAVANLADRQNASFWKMVARCFEGRLLIRRGEVEAGVRRLREELETSARSGWAIWCPDFLGTLAEGLGLLGRNAEALTAIEEALTRAERNGELWCFPELLRIKAELQMKLGGEAGEREAEQCFANALAAARQQNAQHWELRIAVSLARVRAAQGKHAEARQILEPIYTRFADGFTGTDRLRAKELLDMLPA